MERGSVWSVEREMKSEIRYPKSDPLRQSDSAARGNPKSEVRPAAPERQRGESPKEAVTGPTGAPDMIELRVIDGHLKGIGLEWFACGCMTAPVSGVAKPLPPARHKLNLKRGTASEYCPGCGMLRSECDCWDPVNQPQ